MSYIPFLPIYQKRVWGGRNLETFLKRSLPQNIPIGESWEIVDRPEAQSVVSAGQYQGKSLRELIEQHSEDVMGPHWPDNKPFPILVKWLDCAQRLSLQVHPPAHIAQELGGEPKSEMWYIAKTQKNSALIAGLAKGVTRAMFENALKNNTLEQCVHRFNVKVGDSLFVPSGRIHAIDAGNVILEIQENSDTTYRVYDWGRIGLDGKPRQLHVEKSLRSIDFNDFEPHPEHAKSGEQVLASCNSFRIRKMDLSTSDKPLQFGVGEQTALLSVAEGQLHLKSSVDKSLSIIEKGSTILLPYSEHFAFEATRDSTILITDHFVK